MTGLDAHYAGPSESPAWEDWIGRASVGDPCEVTAGGAVGTIAAFDLDAVTVRLVSGDTLTLDWSDVGPVTGY